MFRIKICGITSIEDGLAAAKAGADAIGLNFYKQSPRFVSPPVAREIAAAMPPGVVKVGLFVDTPAGEISRLFDDIALDMIQLHGDQPPEFIGLLCRRPVVRAFRVGAERLQPVERYLARCKELSTPLEAVLLDAMVAGLYGGTGKSFDWDVARSYTEHAAQDAGLPPLVLAGGLTPENVSDAIRSVQPAAIDTAGGVEVQPGRKDAEAMSKFVQAARSAFAR